MTSLKRSWRRTKRIAYRAQDISCQVVIYGLPVAFGWVVWGWFA